MKQYCPRQPPLEQPGYASIQVYLRHTKPITKILTQMKTWLSEAQMTISLTPIQEEKAQEICWLSYTTKQSNCTDLAIAITAMIGIPTTLHFKQIQTSKKQGTKALAIHIMVAAQQVKEVMQHLKQIYGEDRMRVSANKFPLGQQLLLPH